MPASSGFEAVLEELAECVSGVSMEDDLKLRQLGESISRYLATVSPTARWVFLRRYFHCESIQEIAVVIGLHPHPR